MTSLDQREHKKHTAPDWLAIDDNIPLKKAVERFERFFIPRVLKLHGGHKGKTAETLRIDRKTLYRKLKKFGLNGEHTG